MHAQRTKSVLEQALLATHVFVLILLLAESRLVIPDWLHVVGRLHPVLLHFPIVLLLIAVAILLFPQVLKNKADQEYYGSYLLLWGCVLSAFTVIAGLFLSLEEGGGNSQALQNHKWTGVAVFWLSSLLYILSDRLAARPRIKTGVVSLMAVLVIVTGHLGASLTHGEDFITAPLRTGEVQLVTLEEAEIFDHVIQPILENKCIGCHKASKQKGELRLDGMEHILKGGESGPALVQGDIEKSLLAHHISLPLEEEGHMPPKSKPQLTDEETELILSWIASGGDFSKKVLAYDPEAPIFQLASQRFEDQPKGYEFKAADAATVESLNNFYRKVASLGAGSPALTVSYFSRQNFDAESLKDLYKVENQVVVLNLNQMPVKDEDLALLSRFTNLEKLYLNFADIQNEGLKHLAPLKKLQHLSLTGNPLDASSLTALGELKGLKMLYLWSTGLRDEDIDALEKALPNTVIERGYSDDGTIFRLTPPRLKFENAFFKDEVKVEVEHAIKSTQVYYTLDGSSPDSLSSLLYSEPVTVKSNLTFKAKAFAEGWIGSEEASAEFIKSSIRPKTYFLKQPPSDRYKGDLEHSLFDGIKGIPDVWDLAWLGFIDTPLEVEMAFDGTVDIDSIQLSIWYNPGSHVFPPSEVEIWTSSKEGDWELASRSKMPTPAKDTPSALKRIPVPFNATSVEKMRLIARPAQLPTWHGAAGRKAWIMIDELVIN